MFINHLKPAIIVLGIFSTALGSANDNKWGAYIKRIESAVANYNAVKDEQCPTPDNECKCHESVIDRDIELYKKAGITKDLIDKAKSKGAFYQIIDHKLYREEDCMFPARCSGVEHFILNVIEEIPDMEFVLNSRDWPQIPSWDKRLDPPPPVFSFSKDTNHRDIMYPAWTFWEGGPAISLYPTGIGRWNDHIKSVGNAGKKWSWSAKAEKAFFRGSRTSQERDPLVLLSRKHPELVDAQYTKNQAWKSPKDTLDAEPAKEVGFEEHCEFKYLFNFRGVAASFRFKHLFLCASLVFHVGDEWTEFFYPALRPWVHYIPVKTDLSDAWELIQLAKENDDVVRDIARRGRDFIVNHLRMEDVQCFWKTLLKRYASCVKYELARDPALRRILPKSDDMREGRRRHKEL